MQQKHWWQEDIRKAKSKKEKEIKVKSQTWKKSNEKGHLKKDHSKLKKKDKSTPNACVTERDANDSKISLVALPPLFHSDKQMLNSGYI